MAFAKKRLAVTFQFGKGRYGERGYTEVKLSGPLRASATVSVAAGPATGQLELVVYGMTRSNMNDFTIVGKLPPQERINNVIVEAGDDDAARSVVYQGTIREAWADFSAAPDVPFRVTGWTGGLDAMKPIPPTTYRGLTDVATILSGLATLANRQFINNGVTTQLIDPYFPGTALDQIHACAAHANINYVLDNNELAIWPKGSSRNDLIPVVSSATGLVGYPAFTQRGIRGRIIYNPSIRFGQKIKIESSVMNGTYAISSLVHVLESETPGGQWFSTFEATIPEVSVTSRAIR